MRLRAFGQIELHDAVGTDLRVVLAHRKRLALLAYLALSGPHAARGREALAGVFWPESPEDAARHSLREALRFLRQTLGAHVIATHGGSISLDRNAVSTDVADFNRAISELRFSDALAIYRGPLLDGFYVSGISGEFERWLEEERSRLLSLAIRAAVALADEAEQSGNVALAARWAEDHSRLDPFDERVVRRRMTLLERIGDRAGAFRAYEALSERLSREFEVSPSEETRALAAQLRSVGETPVHIAVPAPHTPPSVEDFATDEPAVVSRMGLATPTPVGRRFSSLRLPSRMSVSLVLATVVIAVVALARGKRARTSHELLAVGTIRVQGRDTILSPGLLRQLIASDLARIDGVDVVSGERIDELLAPLGPGADTGRAVAFAARRAGATQIVQGIISSGTDGALRIDMQRVDLARGTIRAAQTIEAANIFSLADRLSEQIASELGRPFRRIPLAKVTSTSLVARRFYEEGVRSFYQGNHAGALRLLEAALREDSTFVMANFYAAHIAQIVRGDSAAWRLMARAVRLSRRAPERERLLVSTGWAALMNSPSWVPLAESLATRYPLEADGDSWLGAGLTWSGDPVRAIPYLRRAIERDSSSMAAVQHHAGGGNVICRACDAFSMLVTSYALSDSSDAAARTAREWIRRQPAGYAGWEVLATIDERSGRLDEARNALSEASRRAGRDLIDAIVRARLAIREGDFSFADRLLADQAAAGDPTIRTGALWWLGISLRQQGRFREALRVAERRLREEAAAFGPNENFLGSHLARAQSLFELGRFAEAAAAFDSLASVPQPFDEVGLPDTRGLSARHRTWGLTQVATAVAAVGDTARLRRLADSVSYFGALEAYGRDRKLHFYVRGLLLEARGDYPAAAVLFQRAIVSPNLGFTRINLELARVLIALHRPMEAAATLQSALRGDFEGSNLYVTHTELHEALAQAFDAASQPDSARVHYANVARAWRSADGPLRVRASAAAQRGAGSRAAR